MRSRITAVGALVLVLSAGAAHGVVLNYVASLDGAQSGHPESPGTGSGTFTIDTDANTMSYNITFGGLLGAETVSHIHGFAPPGLNAGVLHLLPLGSPKIGVWNYLESQEAGILAGLTYVNIHSTYDGSGEIRGQIVVPEPASMVLLAVGAGWVLRRRSCW